MMPCKHSIVAYGAVIGGGHINKLPTVVGKNSTMAAMTPPFNNIVL